MGISREKDDLLIDIKASIEKALDARMTDLAGALYRLQGSTSGWCDHADCGPCPLAPLKCVTQLDERVNELITKHHHAKGTEKPENTKKVEDNSLEEASAANSPKGELSETEIKLYAYRLHHQLGDRAPDYISKKLRSINPMQEPTKVKDWNRIRAELTNVVLNGDEPNPHKID